MVSPCVTDIVAGSNWNVDATTSIVLTSATSPRSSCRAHGPAVAAQSTRTMIRFLVCLSTPMQTRCGVEIFQLAFAMVRMKAAKIPIYAARA